MNKSKLLFIALCILSLAACTVTTAKINSGVVMDDAEHCDNSVAVSDGIFIAYSICYKNEELIHSGDDNGD